MANIKHGAMPGKDTSVRSDAIERFRSSIAAAGLTPPDEMHGAVLAALKAIVNECTDYPTEPRYSTDSYLPAHLMEVAQQAIDAAAQGGIQ